MLVTSILINHTQRLEKEIKKQAKTTCLSTKSIYIEVLKFDDFNFGEILKIAKKGQNYNLAKINR